MFCNLEPDRTGSSKKRRCTRKQSEAETATKRRKATARRNTNTGNMPVQINSNISGTFSIDFYFICILSIYLVAHADGHTPNHTRIAYTLFVLNMFAGSESEDNSDPINSHKLQRPSKSHQYNFLVQLGMISRNFKLFLFHFTIFTHFCFCAFRSSNEQYTAHYNIEKEDSRFTKNIQYDKNRIGEH